MNEYTLQVDRHGNRIICKGDRVRNAYRIVFEGTYRACCTASIEAMNTPAIPSIIPITLLSSATTQGTP